MSRRVASPFVLVDHARCEACWECIAVCPESVFDKIEFWRHRHAVINAGDRCLGCGLCVRACAAGALSERDSDGSSREGAHVSASRR